MDQLQLIQRTQERISELEHFIECTNWRLSKAAESVVSCTLAVNKLLLLDLFEHYNTSCNINGKAISSNQLRR